MQLRAMISVHTAREIVFYDPPGTASISKVCVQTGGLRKDRHNNPPGSDLQTKGYGAVRVYRVSFGKYLPLQRVTMISRPPSGRSALLFPQFPSAFCGGVSRTRNAAGTAGEISAL